MDPAESKEAQNELNNAQKIAALEAELVLLKNQLHQTEQQIRLKSQQLSLIMAQSVSMTDLEEILDLASMDRTVSSESVSPKAVANKKKKKDTKKKKKAKKVWENIEKHIKNGNIEYIKKMIESNKVRINDNTQYNGRTMLQMAAEHGQYNICSILLNLGSNPTMNTKYDTRDASNFATKKGHFHIEQLLLISSIGGESSAKIKEMIEICTKQQALNQGFMKFETHKNEEKIEWIHQMIDYLCFLIEHKMVFSDDLLSLCWYHNKNGLNSKLWNVIIKSCTQIINGLDPNHWYWLRQYMLKSTLWLQINPNKVQKKGNYELKDLLITKLFDITNKASMKQSQILINMKRKNEKNWNALIDFKIEMKSDIDTEEPRQDSIVNGLNPKYSKQELSQNINPSNTFNALRHYDIEQYLSDLVLRCHLIDDAFQESVMHIFSINGATNTNVNAVYDEKEDEVKLIKYRHGPVKQISRCKAKAENDYRVKEWPTSAHLLDIIRCTLIFEDVDSLLKGLTHFNDKVNGNDGGVIKEIVRVKNGFNEYNASQPQYADIKLNVRVQSKNGNGVIGEIQFLLSDMSTYKVSAHKLYNILRLNEEFVNVLKIKPIMMDEQKRLLNASYFNNSKEISNIMVTHQRNIKYILDNIDVGIVCKTNGIKIVKLLKEYIDRKDLVNRLKECGGFTIVCNKGHFQLIKYIYSNILKKYNKKGEYDEILKNGLSEVINGGHFEILMWMFHDDTFRSLWHKLPFSDKHDFFTNCCYYGYLNVAKLLKRHFGANFDITLSNQVGNTALMKAIESKQIETVKWLITLPNIDLIAENKRGLICLFGALDVGCIEIGDLLLTQYEKQGHNPRDMLMHKSTVGDTIQTYVYDAGLFGRKRKQAKEAVLRWAKQYDVVELLTQTWDFSNIDVKK